MSIQACNSIDSFVINHAGNIELGATVCGDPLTLTAHYDSEWNAEHLVLGTYHIWVDATGDLRIMDGAPASDTDAASFVIGTQTATP